MTNALAAVVVGCGLCPFAVDPGPGGYGGFWPLSMWSSPTGRTTVDRGPGSVVGCSGGRLSTGSPRGTSNPADPVRSECWYRALNAARAEFTTVGRDVFFGRLLPAVPHEHRALVGLAAGTGLRWGECVGLAWRRSTSMPAACA